MLMGAECCGGPQCTSCSSRPDEFELVISSSPTCVADGTYVLSFVDIYADARIGYEGQTICRYRYDFPAPPGDGLCYWLTSFILVIRGAPGGATEFLLTIVYQQWPGQNVTQSAIVSGRPIDCRVSHLTLSPARPSAWCCAFLASDLSAI